MKTEKLTLRHLACYLPYGLKVQYEGVLNGKEIGAYTKKWNVENDNDTDFYLKSEYNPPAPITGLKIGYIKKVGVFKSGTEYRIGTRIGGLQTHYGTSRFKPLLRPLSDLTKEIEHNGVLITPIVELFKLAIFRTWNDEAFNQFNQFQVEVKDGRAYLKDKGRMIVLSYDEDGFELLQYEPKYEHFKFINQREMFEKLYEWKFDIYNLIPYGLALDINNKQN